MLAVATVFIGLWTPIFTFYSQGGGAYLRETKLPMQELELAKIAGGGAYARGGHICVIVQYIIYGGGGEFGST